MIRSNLPSNAGTIVKNVLYEEMNRIGGSGEEEFTVEEMDQAIVSMQDLNQLMLADDLIYFI